MKISIVAFGKIADIIDAKTWVVEGVKSTHELRKQLETMYPELQGMQYSIALDKKIVTADTPLNAGGEVALLPPFSGG